MELLSHHRGSVIRVHADGGSRGAADPRDGVEGLADIDVKVWGSITLVHGVIRGGVVSGGVDKRGQLNQVRAVLDGTLHLGRYQNRKRAHTWLMGAHVSRAGIHRRHTHSLLADLRRVEGEEVRAGLRVRVDQHRFWTGRVHFVRPVEQTGRVNAES